MTKFSTKTSILNVFCKKKTKKNKKDKGHLGVFPVGYVKIFESLVHNPDLKELNELRTRIIFFLKLDSGKSGLSVPLNSRLMTSSGHVTKMK